MPRVFLALFYDKLTGRCVSFCRIFFKKHYNGEKGDKVTSKFWKVNDSRRADNRHTYWGYLFVRLETATSSPAA